MNSDRASTSSSHETLSNPEPDDSTVATTSISDTKKSPDAGEISENFTDSSFVDWDGPDDPENPKKYVASKTVLKLNYLQTFA